MLSYERIYQYIIQGKKRDGELYNNLRHKLEIQKAHG